MFINFPIPVLLHRHAAELATAKKKNPNLNGTDLSAPEEEYSSDEEISEKMLKSKDQFMHTSVGVSQSWESTTEQLLQRLLMYKWTVQY